jgi:hypothetical protein
VRAQDARFQELIAHYQQTVVKADSEVEDGLALFLKAQEEASHAKDSVEAELGAVKDAIAQYKGGLADFNRVAVVEDQLVSRQNALAQAQGDIALGLIQVYRALGGGWQIRCDASQASGTCGVAARKSPAESIAPLVLPPPEIGAAAVKPPVQSTHDAQFVPVRWRHAPTEESPPLPITLPPITLPPPAMKGSSAPPNP